MHNKAEQSASDLNLAEPQQLLAAMAMFALLEVLER